jgi:hypothetical protein
MRGFIAKGKQVRDAAGGRFATAVTEVGAKLIVAALNFRHHRPEVDAGTVRCARCQVPLPDHGDEPCVPKAPRCPSTVDMFEDEMATDRTCSRCSLPMTASLNNEPLCERHLSEAIEGPKQDRRPVPAR